MLPGLPHDGSREFGNRRTVGDACAVGRRCCSTGRNVQEQARRPPSAELARLDGGHGATSGRGEASRPSSGHLREQARAHATDAARLACRPVRNLKVYRVLVEALGKRSRVGAHHVRWNVLRHHFRITTSPDPAWPSGRSTDPWRASAGRPSRPLEPLRPAPGASGQGRWTPPDVPRCSPAAVELNEHHRAIGCQLADGNGSAKVAPPSVATSLHEQGRVGRLGGPHPV